MKTKFTPGPWKAEQHSGFEWSVVVRDGGKMDGATIAHQIFQAPEANARLISAAPELLIALKGLLSLADNENLYDEWKAEFTAAENAIAKAEGSDRNP